jgi:hypothetical protein
VTNLVIKQGTDPDIRIPNVRDADGDLITTWTGFSVKGQVRERPESPTVLHEWTSQGGTPNVSFEGSDVVLALPHATSTAFAWRHARYDVELTDPSGLVARIAEGHITVDREVTR